MPPKSDVEKRLEEGILNQRAFLFLYKNEEVKRPEAGLFEQGEARARADVDALRASYGDDSLEVATASDILVRALVLNGRAARDETLTLARTTLRIKESHVGTERVELVPSLLNL